MTAQRARHAHARHTRASTAARSVPTHLAHIHPDWLPPSGYAPDGTYLDPADDRDPPDTHVADAAALDPTGLPREFNSRAGPSTTTPPTAPDAHAVSNSPSPSGALPWIPGSMLPPPDPDHPTDEDAIFRNPTLYGSGRERQLSYTALPLRHQIYALHCQGRSLSAIARSLRLDRGTVARHLHATEDLLLAEQTEDLARLRLRAVEAQHAILAAAWDALLCEELNESDASNEQPYPARRAQLLATAARAARTAAQLQGLFTPAALAAALRDRLPADATPADGAAVSPAASTSGPPPRAGEGLGERSTAAANCGMPASVHAVVAPPPEQPGLPREFNSRSGSPTTPPPTAESSAANPAANCGMPASASGSPPLAGEGLGERSPGSPLHRGGKGLGERSASRPASRRT